MTDFSFNVDSQQEEKTLVNDAEFKTAKKAKVDLTSGLKRYDKVRALLTQGKDVAAGLKATNDPDNMRLSEVLKMFLANLEEAMK